MVTDAGHDVPPTAGREGRLGDRWRGWRNRLVASPKFQRWAAATPLVSRIARRRSEELFELTSGFVRSQILLAAVESGLLAHLSRSKSSLREIANALDLGADAASRLLSACESVRLVEQDGGDFWWLSQIGAVAAANPGIEAMIRHHKMLYADLADPLHLLRNPKEGTQTSGFWAYAQGGSQVSARDAADYSRLMRLSQDLVSEQVLAAYPFGRHKTIADIGGGDGTFIEALAKRCPEASFALFDLAPVAESAARRLSSSLGSRLSVHDGDFFETRLPEAECMTLIRVLCDHDDSAAARLLANIRRSLRPGGTLVVAEAMAGGSRGEAMSSAYFGFYFLAMRSGRCRKPEEIQSLVRAAGFRNSRRMATRTPLVASFIAAKT